MPISNFEKAAAFLLKSYKIQLAVILFLDVLDQLVTPPFEISQNTLYIYRKKEKLWYLWLWVPTVLLTKFGLSVSSVWSPGLIEKLTIMKWPCDFQKVPRYKKPGSYILDFVLAGRGAPESEKFEVELFCFDMLLINKFYIKKYILCWLNKIMLRNPCTNF